MPRFDLQKYATVAERLAMLEAQYPDYRLETHDYSTDADRAKGIWRVKATLYLNRDDQIDGVAKATGHAFEIDSAHGPQATSGLEVCETSAVGRCLSLASAAWTGNKDEASKSLASREEMQKVMRGPQLATRDWVAEAENLNDVDALRLLWKEAKSARASTAELDKVKERAEQVERATSVGEGNSDGASGSTRTRK